MRTLLAALLLLLEASRAEDSPSPSAPPSPPPPSPPPSFPPDGGLTNELCGDTTTSALCGGAVDAILLVQASAGVSDFHDEISTAIDLFIDSFSFEADPGDPTDGSAQPWSPRLGLVTFSIEPTNLVNMTASKADLVAAVASRPGSIMQPCTSCAIDRAKELIEQLRRAHAAPHVFLMAANMQPLLGGDPQVGAEGPWRRALPVPHRPSGIAVRGTASAHLAARASPPLARLLSGIAVRGTAGARLSPASR